MPEIVLQNVPDQPPSRCVKAFDLDEANIAICLANYEVETMSPSPREVECYLARDPHDAVGGVLGRSGDVQNLRELRLQLRVIDDDAIFGAPMRIPAYSTIQKFSASFLCGLTYT